MSKATNEPETPGELRHRPTPHVASAAGGGWIWGALSGLGWSVAAVTFAVDQLNKWWMLNILGLNEKARGLRIKVLPFLDLIYVKNIGISYGLLTQHGQLGQWLLAIFAILCSLLLGIWIARTVGNKLIVISLGLIVGGALGNALDRVLAGGVHDFYLLYAFGFSWYVFNIADAAIVAGVVGLLYDSLIASRKDAAK